MLEFSSDGMTHDQVSTAAALCNEGPEHGNALLAESGQQPFI